MAALLVELPGAALVRVHLDTAEEAVKHQVPAWQRVSQPMTVVTATIIVSTVAL
jgi:hypothetical protein